VCGDTPDSHANGDIVIPYPGTSGAVASTSFTLVVDGKAVFVESFGGLSYAHFAFSGTAHVTISDVGGAKALAGYSLRPQSFGIKATTDKEKVTFDLAVPRKLLFWNGTPDDMLIILADSLEDQSYRPSDPGVTDVASYGVTASDGKIETALIQKALDQVAAGPGGVLYFGSGTYLTGTLRIGSQTTVYLAPGATLRGTGATADYRGIPSSPAASPAKRRPSRSSFSSSSTPPSILDSSAAASST
jgi:hypothetical protein